MFFFCLCSDCLANQSCVSFDAVQGVVFPLMIGLQTDSRRLQDKGFHPTASIDCNAGRSIDEVFEERIIHSVVGKGTMTHNKQFPNEVMKTETFTSETDFPFFNGYSYRETFENALKESNRRCHFSPLSKDPTCSVRHSFSSKNRHSTEFGRSQCIACFI